MISARKFYSATRASRRTTLNRVVEHITGNNSKNIIFLPPVPVNANRNSDTENTSDNFDNDNAILNLWHNWKLMIL